MQLRDLNLSEYDTLLLDRDGVINVLRPNDYVKCWEEFVFLPGVLETLGPLRSNCQTYFYCDESTRSRQGDNDRTSVA